MSSAISLQCPWNQEAYNLICDKLNHLGNLVLESNYKIYHLILVLESNYKIYCWDVRCQKKWRLKQPPLSVSILQDEARKGMEMQGS